MMHKALDIAIQECNSGVIELAGVKHNPRILAYHSATTLRASTDEVPWCASFVNWCLREAGLEGTASASARSFLRWGFTIPTDNLEAGDVVIFARGNNSEQGHVAFFVEWSSKSKGLMNIIGGNQSNRVSMETYSTKRLLGARRLL